MTQQTPGAPDPGIPHYRIRVDGRLHPWWADRFPGMTLSPQADGTTVIAGPVADQAALHGLLRTVRDLALPLHSLSRRSADEPNREGAPS